MKTLPTLNPQWESGNDFPGAILEKSADLKYFTTAIAEEPCKNWMRPHTQPTKDERTRRLKKSPKCGCTPKSAPAATISPRAVTLRKSSQVTSPIRNEPKRISFSDDREVENKRWGEKVRQQNYFSFSRPRSPYRSYLGSGKYRSGSPLTQTRKLREGFWGPLRIKPTDIVPEVPKSPRQYLPRAEMRPTTATASFSLPDSIVDTGTRPFTAPSLSGKGQARGVSFRQLKSLVEQHSSLTHSIFRPPRYRSATRVSATRASAAGANDLPDSAETAGDIPQSRRGTIGSVSSAHRMSSGERILRERSTRSLERIRNFLNQKLDRSTTVLSSVPELSQIDSISERKETIGPDTFASLLQTESKAVVRLTEENDIPYEGSEVSDGIPKVLPFPPQFYRRRRNRGLYGIFPSDKPPPLPYTPPHHPPRIPARVPSSGNDNMLNGIPRMSTSRAK